MPCCGWSIWSSTRAIRRRRAPRSRATISPGEAIRLGTAAGGVAGRARGRGPARADAAPGVAARRADIALGRSRCCSTPRIARRWDRALIVEGVALVERALGGGPPGPYALQAAIAAVHADASRAPPTRIGRRSSACTTCCCGRTRRPSSRSIARLPWPCVTGRRPDSRSSTRSWRAASSATTNSPTRPGPTAAAGSAAWPRPARRTQRALALARQEPERRFLERRLRELS